MHHVFLSVKIRTVQMLTFAKLMEGCNAVLQLQLCVCDAELFPICWQNKIIQVSAGARVRFLFVC